MSYLTLTDYTCGHRLTTSISTHHTRRYKVRVKQNIQKCKDCIIEEKRKQQEKQQEEEAFRKRRRESLKRCRRESLLKHPNPLRVNPPDCQHLSTLFSSSLIAEHGYPDGTPGFTSQPSPHLTPHSSARRRRRRGIIFSRPLSVIREGLEAAITQDNVENSVIDQGIELDNRTREVYELGSPMPEIYDRQTASWISDTRQEFPERIIEKLGTLPSSSSPLANVRTTGIALPVLPPLRRYSPLDLEFTFRIKVFSDPTSNRSCTSQCDEVKTKSMGH